MSTPWTISQYDLLFRDRAPTQPHAPAGTDLDELAGAFGRSAKAVLAQWDDARSAVLDNRTAASAQLVGYLRRRGWLK
jgi:hypothetical protein